MKPPPSSGAKLMMNSSQSALPPSSSPFMAPALPTETIYAIIHHVLAIDDDPFCLTKVKWASVAGIAVTSRLFREILLRIWCRTVRISMGQQMLNIPPSIAPWVRQVKCINMANATPKTFTMAPNLRSVILLGAPQSIVSSVRRLPPSLGNLHVQHRYPLGPDRSLLKYVGRLYNLVHLNIDTTSVATPIKFVVPQWYPSPAELGSFIAHSLSKLHRLRTLTIGVYVTPAEFYSVVYPQRRRTNSELWTEFGPPTREAEILTTQVIANALPRLERVTYRSYFSHPPDGNPWAAQQFNALETGVLQSGALTLGQFLQPAAINGMSTEAMDKLRKNALDWERDRAKLDWSAIHITRRGQHIVLNRERDRNAVERKYMPVPTDDLCVVRINDHKDEPRGGGSSSS